MLGNFNWGLPEAASTYAGVIDAGIIWIHWGMLAIFVLWGLYMAYTLVRYRRRPGVPAQVPRGPQWHAITAGLAVLVIETFVIIGYDFPVWAKIRIDFPNEAQSNVVDVVAQQFAWNFQYPSPDGKFGRRDPQFIDSSNTIGIDPADPAGKQNVLTVNELHVPMGKPTILHFASMDVIHDFFVPAFRMKTDIMPGMKIDLWFEPTKTGTFEIGCAQLCGIGHSSMRGDLIVQTPEDYKAWLDGQLKAKLESQ